MSEASKPPAEHVPAREEAPVRKSNFVDELFSFLRTGLIFSIKIFFALAVLVILWRHLEIYEVQVKADTVRANVERERNEYMRLEMRVRAGQIKPEDLLKELDRQQNAMHPRPPAAGSVPPALAPVGTSP